MSGVIAPVVIGTVFVAVVALFWRTRSHARRAFDAVLLDKGFTPVADAPSSQIDFTVSLQWPDGRGIEYLRSFGKQVGSASFAVANVQCWEVTGARMGKLGAAMKPDEIRQTVLSVSFSGQELPRFSLCPMAWADQFRTFSEGGERIESGDAAFDDRFFIVGTCGTDVRTILTDRIRRELLSMPGTFLAAGNSSVLVFQQGVVLSAADLEGYVSVLEMIGDETTER